MDRSRIRTRASQWSVGCFRSADVGYVVANCLRASGVDFFYDEQGSLIRTEHPPARRTPTDDDVMNPGATVVLKVVKPTASKICRAWLVRQLPGCETNPVAPQRLLVHILFP